MNKQKQNKQKQINKQIKNKIYTDVMIARNKI